MINLAEEPKKPASEEPFIIDEKTGIKRPKHVLPKEKPKGVTPKYSTNSDSDFVELQLKPEDWFLAQSSIMACLPVNFKNEIPVELVKYVNSNFNTYPSDDMKYYVNDFKHSLLLKNHDPKKAYGFTVDVKPRVVTVGKHNLDYIDILVAVNKHIDGDFAEKIRTEVIKFLSWGHTSADYVCSICGEHNGECSHISDMMMRNTPTPAILGGKPYGIIHRFTPEFHVYDVSYLDVRPAYDGAITHKIIELDKPLSVMVSKKLFNDKAIYATAYEDELEPDEVISELLSELNI